MFVHFWMKQISNPGFIKAKFPSNATKKNAGYSYSNEWNLEIFTFTFSVFPYCFSS